MANVYPFNPGHNFRLQPPVSKSGATITVIAEGDDDDLDFDPETGSVQVPLPDGTVEISFGKPTPTRTASKFESNLAEYLTEAELGTIAEKLLMGIEQDEQSRQEWLENISAGISLLGLKVKMPAGAAVSGGSPAEGTSVVDHPLLLEAVLRFQANALAEMLPADGPVKVRNDGEGNALATRLAEALEKDLNHYLTKVAKEYYPDTDRMLLMLGFCGISFKKGFHDPIKRRPVIASIDAKDLIVSNAATDIDGAGRVTHRVKMRPSMLRRMQLVGAYRDIHLPSPGMPMQKDAVGQKIDQIQGIAPPSYIEPDDQDRELYECYCEIEVPGFEHVLDGQDTGLPLPYKVTIDREARRILEIRRNWDEADPFCLPINRIIAYTFIPGLGFYGIGLLNVLGNATRAVTAAWRLMIDAGMFSNFPGFLYLKSLSKQLSNNFRVAPGTGMPVDTIGNDIRASIMALPYKDPSAVFIQLIDNIAGTAQRVGGTAELQVGEGKQDAPVGTTLALIEQARKLMSAVHKRMHMALGQECDMLKSLLMEDPAALWRHNKKSKVLAMLIAESGLQPIADQQQQAEERHREMFLAALADCELLPASDPNTSSQTERYLKIVAARQMAGTNPNINMDEVDKRAFDTMGFDDAESLFKPPPDPNLPPPPPPPEAVTAQATMIAAQARQVESQARMAEAQAKARQAAMETQTDAQIKQAELASKERIASLGVARELVIHNADQEAARYELGIQNRNQAADRIHKLSLQTAASRAQARESGLARAHEFIQSGVAQHHENLQNRLTQAHQHVQNRLARTHEHVQNELNRQHELAMQPPAEEGGEEE